MKRVLVVLGFGAIAAVGCKSSSSNGGSCDAGVSECAQAWDCPVGQTCDVESGCCVDFGCTAGSCSACEFCADDFTCKSISAECEFTGCECHIVSLTGEFGDLGTPPVPPRFALPSGASTAPHASLALQKGSPLEGGSCVPFAWSIIPSPSTAFSVNPTTGEVTALAGAAPGTTETLRATVTLPDNSSFFCEATVVQLGDAPPTGVRFFVFDDATGAPIDGAELIADIAGSGDENDEVGTTAGGGIATIAGLTGGVPYNISAFADGYNYLSIVGLNSTSQDIALPLSKRAVPKTTGGFDGKADFSPYEKRVLGGKPKTIKFGLAAGSFPLRALLNFDFDLFVGPMTDADCGACAPTDTTCAAGCYKIPTIVGNDPLWTSLPGGLLLSLATTSIKGHFDGVAAPGRRYGWSLAGEIEPGDISPLVGMIMDAACTCEDNDGVCDAPACDCEADCGGADLNIGELFNALTPLFGVFGSGVKGNLPLPEVFMTDWEAFLASGTYDQRTANANRLTTYSAFPLLDRDGVSGALGKMDIREPLEVFTNFDLYSGYAGDANMPPDGQGGRMDGLIVITAVNAKGYGIVPMGLGAGLDCTAADCANTTNFDGIIDGQLMCKFNADPTKNQCRPGVPTTPLADGHLGLFHARAHGGLEGQEWVTIALALPVVDLTASGDVRATALIVRQEPESGASTQLGGAYPVMATQPASAANRQYAVVGGEANVHWVTVATGEYTAGTTTTTTRWNIYFPSTGGTFTAPSVPASVGCDCTVNCAQVCDPFVPAPAGSDIAENHVNATHLGFAAPGATLADYAANNGTILTDLIDAVTGFTLQSRDIPAQ